MRRVELRYRPQLKLPPIPGLPVPYSTIAKYRTNIVRHASLDLGFHSTHTMPPINGLTTRWPEIHGYDHSKFRHKRKHHFYLDMSNDIIELVEVALADRTT